MCWGRALPSRENPRAATPLNALILCTGSEYLYRIAELKYYFVDFGLVLTASSAGALREPTERFIPQLFNS